MYRILLINFLTDAFFKNADHIYIYTLYNSNGVIEKDLHTSPILLTLVTWCNLNIKDYIL